MIEENSNISLSQKGLVLIDSVSKRFRKHTVAKRSYSTIKSRIISRIFRKEAEDDSYLHVLSDLTIKVEPGESVGIIGRNGSGKSTLLKLISGIYRPDSGRIIANGRISALIELGAGFHPDFTGRENIYLGGVMYGLSRKEIDKKFDAIVAYAELEDFIDDPVRTYSSGMYMRLGFSLAVHTDPDILLIDEVLAVGDAGFIHRCHETISEFRRKGKTMVFVTHDLASVVRWCDEAIWLEDGLIKKRGEPKIVIDSYMQHVQEEEENKLNKEHQLEDDSPEEGQVQSDTRWGSGDVLINSVTMCDAQGQPKWAFTGDSPVTVDVEYEVVNDVEELVFGVGIIRADGVCIHGTNTEMAKVKANFPTKAGSKGKYSYCIKRLGLVEDTYFLDVAAHRKDGSPYDYQHMMHKFTVRSTPGYVGMYCPESEWNFYSNVEL